MIIPVKCFTCGEVLGDKYLFYLEQTRKKKLNKGVDVDRLLYLTKEYTAEAPVGEVLDTLGLTKMCCRRHMLTHVDVE